MVYSIPLLFALRDAPSSESLPQDKSWVENAGTNLFMQRTKLLLMQPIRAVAELLTNGSFILLVIYFTLPAMAGWVVKDWMPAILKTQFNIGQGKAGVSATLYVNIAALIGVIVGGWLADKWMRRPQAAWRSCPRWSGWPGRSTTRAGRERW